MPKPIRLFVKYVDAVNYYVGRFAMYLFFVLGACLLYSTFSRVVLGVPVNWVLEMSQFCSLPIICSAAPTPCSKARMYVWTCSSTVFHRAGK